MRTTLRVNGESWTVELTPDRLLLDVLRDDLGLTGARRGCESSYCGACTVQLDGKVVHSCSVLAVTALDCEITTVEGLARGETLHPVQEAFLECGGVQCGYCTPGFVLTACSLLKEEPNPSEEQIRRWLLGNLCRCTGYHKIVQAVDQAARAMKCE